MYSIFDFFQKYLLGTWETFIFISATIFDILCVALIIYAIYHFLLILEDCFASPKRNNYVHGASDFGNDTDTSTESDFGDFFKHPISKSIPTNKVIFGEFTDDDDELLDNFSRIQRAEESSGDESLETFTSSSHSSNLTSENNETSSLDKIFDLPSSRPLQQNLDNVDLLLAGSGTYSLLSNNPSNNNLSNAPLSDDDNFPAQPIAQSSPLQKNYQDDKKY